jgi:rhamnosyltransferase
MMYNRNDVCAVVVTYFPDSDLPQRLQRIAEQVDRIVLVDNGTQGQALETVDRAAQMLGNLDMISNNANLGVATALNQGAQKALDNHYPWVITFDQDSLPAAQMVNKLLKFWERYPQRRELMILGPEVRIHNFSSQPDILSDHNTHKEVTHVITSGSLIASRAFETAGYFLDSLFIDYVDIEYCMRLRSRGYKIIQVKNALLHHRLGQIERRKFLWKTVHPSHHDAQRRYYQYRNAVLLDRYYCKTLPEWCNYNRVVLLKTFILILLYEKQKAKKIRSILKGIFHGLKGRAGCEGELAFVKKDIAGTCEAHTNIEG